MQRAQTLSCVVLLVLAVLLAPVHAAPGRSPVLSCGWCWSGAVSWSMQQEQQQSQDQSTELIPDLSIGLMY
jgi:hypothetical protein